MSDLNNPFDGIDFDDDSIFGAVAKDLSETSPSLFKPRSLGEYKNDLLDKGKLNEDQEITEFDILLDDLSSTHAERMNSILGNMSDTAFAQSYMRLLTWVKPKLKAIEANPVVPQELTQINVTIINNKTEIHNERN